VSRPPNGAGPASSSSLDDRVRRLYEFCCRAPGRPDGTCRQLRPESAAHWEVYYLGKLVESGQLMASYQRPADRGGPGAGLSATVLHSVRP